MALLLAAAIVAAAGCGAEEPAEAPAACLAPADAYLAALVTAPGDVRLEDGTPIGDCLVEEQQPGELAQVGESMIGAATELNREVRRDFDSQTIAELGYLVGAVRGAAATTGGIHADLALRIEGAARYAPSEEPFPASFERAFGRGYAAGQQNG